MNHHTRRNTLMIALCLVLVLISVLPWPPQMTAHAQAFAPTLQPILGIPERPHSCKPNNDRATACTLPIDSVSGPFTFLPVGDQDWYRVDLGQPNGLETVVSVRADDGLDLLVSLSRDDGTAVTAFATPAISTTLAAELRQPLVIRVENRSPRNPAGKAYTIEIRSVLPPPPDPATLPTAVQPDALENNWDVAHASPIAVDVVYDLTFACPETRADACPGGDHDYLRFPIKAGTSYLLATFDLGPGVDTVLDLYLDDQLDRPLLSNDDARASGGLLSVLRWIAPRNGTAYLRVGPRTGGITPILNDHPAGAGSYRLVVALGRGALANTIEARIAEQTNAPTTPRSGGGNAGTHSSTATPAVTATTPVSDTTNTPANTTVVQGDAVKGTAITLRDTTVRLRPQANGEVIQLLPPATIVTLIGKHTNLWVRVQTDQAVLSGWVLATDLRQYDPAAAAEPTSVAVGATPIVPASTPPTAAQPTVVPIQTMSRQLQITELPPLPIGDRAPAVVSITRVVTVSLRMSAVAPPAKTPIPGQKTTPIPSTPVVGLRIQLVTAFGDLLAEAIAPTSGEVVLTHAITPETALFVRLPALGLLTPVTGPQLTITLPEVVWQP